MAIAHAVYQGTTKAKNSSGHGESHLLTSRRRWALFALIVFPDLKKVVFRMRQSNARSWLWLCIALIPATAGCADGPLWRLGYLNPWVVKRWHEEEELLATLSERRGRIASIRESLHKMTPLESDRAVDYLRETVINEPVLLTRLDAIETLGMIPAPRAGEALQGFLKDPDAQVRLAATHAFETRPPAEAIPALRGVLESENDVDIRLAATRHLGRFREDRAAIDALGVALSDPEPAMQFRAMESLKKVTGRDYGFNARLWQAYLNGEQPDEPASSVADTIRQLF